MPTESHQLIAGFLYEALAQFVRARRLGTVLFRGMPVRVDEGKFREPDVLFMRREHAARRSEQYWEGADLAIEVVSSGHRDHDRVTKRREYARAGIPEYWIVDPERQLIEVLDLAGAAYRTRAEYRPGETAASGLLPGFEVAVDAVFWSAAGDLSEDAGELP